ncbi:MAG: hypothetical protein LBN33_08110 [Desulfovibrio sp.]|jgi:hypothetical protein|nr:hypothetical protein [Desulfovibrio sp.]
MRPLGRPGDLFTAFSRITGRAFKDARLVSCPGLSKAPDQGEVLHRFLSDAPPWKPSFAELSRIAGRYVLANCGHFLFMLGTALFLRLLRFPLTPGAWERIPSAMKTAPPPKGSLRVGADEKKGRPARILLDTFAVSPGIVKEGRYRELYLQGLEEEASACGHRVLTLFRLYGNRDPRLLWKTLKILRGKEGVLFEAGLLRSGDWGRLVLHILLYPFALAALIRSLRQVPENSPQRYIRESLLRGAGQCVLIGEARRLAARALSLDLASAPADPARIISWYENQTLNKCFQRGLADAEALGAPRPFLVGAQLFIWPDNLLNNHPDDAEAALGLAPDLVLVNGPHFLPQSSTQNYAVGPALRYAHLFSKGETKRVPGGVPEEVEQGIVGGGAAAGNTYGKSPQKRPALVLLSYHPAEIERVLRLLLPLAESDPENFVYRFHPATRPNDYAALLPKRARLSEGGLAQALDTAGAVIGAGSGSLAEAAAQGLPVLAVEDASGIPGMGLNYLPEYGRGKLWAGVKDVREMKESLQLLHAARLDPQRPEMVRRFRDLLFCEPDRERIREAFGLYPQTV